MKYVFLLLLACLPLSAFEKTLSICAIFQNEAYFLKEWINFHSLVGVEEFWLYNNNSTDNYEEVLKPFIENGTVHLIEWPSVQEENDWRHYSFVVQTGAYNDCLSRIQGHSKWLAMIDIDEFIVPVEEDNVATILERDYSDVSGLCLNWVMFGTSEIEEIKPGEKMIEKLLRRAPLSFGRNLLYKSVVQPLHVKYCPNPHFCHYHKNRWHVNTDREWCDEGYAARVCIDKLRINHYWTRDEKFFREIKLPRYMKWGADTPEKIQAFMDLRLGLSFEEDNLILRFSNKF